MTWILYTLAAVIFQTLRNLEQKHLNKTLDAITTSWSRFILPFPLAAIVVGITSSTASPSFILNCLTAAFFQACGNIFMIKTLQSKNFSIGIAFYKTEILQAMIVGFLLFDQKLSEIAVAAIIIGTAGVIMMSGLSFNNGWQSFFESLKNKSTAFGLLSGFCFSFSAFNLKNAATVLIASGDSNLLASTTVLLWIIFFQNIGFASVKLAQNRLRQDLKSLFALENKSTFVKLAFLSFIGSICWFVAYSSGIVVYVKALGQIELMIAILVSHFYLKEKHSFVQIAGIALTASGILILLFFTSHS